MVDRPIFIVGPHRSGTTLVYRSLCRHPDLAAFTAADRRMRDFPLLAHAANRLGFGRLPHEAQRIWDRFRTGDGDAMDPAEATPAAIAWHRERVERMLRLRGRPRFVAKYPRLSLRLGWLDAVFPGCLLLHVVRDWRAVVSSTVRRRENRDARGETDPFFGVRIPGWRELDGLSHPVAAARIYSVVTRRLEEEAARFGPRLRRLSYEEYCAAPVRETEAVAAWAGLPFPPAFRGAVDRPLKARNDSWKEVLGDAVVAEARAEDPELFARYEF